MSFQSAPLGRPPPPPPPHWFPPVPSEPPSSCSFWETRNVYNQLKELHETLNLAKAMHVPLALFCFEFNFMFQFHLVVIVFVVLE